MITDEHKTRFNNKQHARILTRRESQAKGRSYANRRTTLPAAADTIATSLILACDTILHQFAHLWQGKELHGSERPGETTQFTQDAILSAEGKHCR